MAKEIAYRYSAAASNLYATVMNSVGQLYNANSSAFETIVDANWTTAKYCRALTEQGTASQIYEGDFPVIAGGMYRVDVYLRAGGSPAITDTQVGAGQMDWDGAAEIGDFGTNIAKLLGTAWATPATAGLPDVNMKQISTDAAAADNAEAFFDGTGYAGTNNVIPRVTLTDTLTTYTGNTVQTGDSFARLGAAGAGLTALGDTRIANLDATVSSRTKPADTQARVTLVDTVTSYTGNTPQTGDAYARLGAPAGASVSADVAAVKTDTTTLLARITSTLFSGITYLARWMGLLAGKTADASTLAEVQATTAGAGFTNTTDSLEALRDNEGTAGAGLTAIPTVARVTLVDTTTAVTNAVAVSSNIKKNQALSGFSFLLVDTSGDPVTGRTVTATRSIDGAAFGACTNSVTEISAGGYTISLSAADLNGNSILLKFAASGAKTRFVEIVTQP